MNAAGAISYRTEDWPEINWRKVLRGVRRLQIRIAEAIEKGKRGKAHALARILARSANAARWAVRRVTENQGKNTPGIDGVIWSTPHQKQEAVLATQKGEDKPLPLRRLYIPKANGKRRPLGIPTMKDRARQALHWLALDPVAECCADPNSYGFRRGRSPADAIEQCFNVLAKRAAPKWVLEGDIAGCFDHIGHEWLLQHIPMNKDLLSKWLKAGYIERRTFHPTEAGTPQGGVISPVLCNMTLDGLEQVLRTRFKGHKVNLVRFADDFIATGDSREFLEQEVLPVPVAFLAERGLSLSEEKTSIVHIEEGFDFLGQNIRKHKDKLIIKPANKAVKRMLDGVRELLKGDQSAKPAAVIAKLNPAIRGWANYHRHVCSKQTFSAMDAQIWKATWRWARRRHPGRPRRWIGKRYFKSKGSRQWVFTGTEPGGKDIHLFHAAALPIKRHVKIQGKANPYNPEHEVYFEKRQARKWTLGLFGSPWVRRLWKIQNGRCRCCGEPITEETGWHLHHRVPLMEGGSDTLENLALLHPVCHRQLHARQRKKPWPAPAGGL